ncbi:MAG: guanosine monophosphate reductase, partial [Deltaproteobacteria bacterium]|nr:guanosine monophosphate reductase [Deltaproteobacteria bacterium]
MKIRKKTYGFDDLLLVPRLSGIETRSSVDLSVDLAGIRLACPIVSSNMDTVTEFQMATAMELLGGLGIIHRYLSAEARLQQLEKVLQLRNRAFAVGVTKDEIAFGKQLIDRGANILCLDVAHGHSTMMERALGELRSYAETVTRARFMPLLRPVFIAGNVATPEGAADLAKWGADVLKVGIGPGSMCTTRIVTGAGYGQLTAIADCAAVTKAPVIADGGIRNSGDATKALAAGAAAVMLGKLLAGTDEVPQWARESGSYRGMASAEAQGGHYGYTFKDRHPEGVATKVQTKGPVSDVQIGRAS